MDDLIGAELDDWIEYHNVMNESSHEDCGTSHQISMVTGIFKDPSKVTEL